MPTATDAEVQPQQISLFFGQHPVEHVADLLVKFVTVSQCVGLVSGAFVYLIAHLYKEVIPQVIGLCVFILLIKR